MTTNQIKQHLQAAYDKAVVSDRPALKTRLRRLYVAYEEGSISLDDLLDIANSA